MIGKRMFFIIWFSVPGETRHANGRSLDGVVVAEMVYCRPNSRVYVYKPDMLTRLNAEAIDLCLYHHYYRRKGSRLVLVKRYRGYVDEVVGFWGRGGENINLDILTVI